MSVKTITIDITAYRLLAAQKQKDESFSQVIKRRLRPAKTASALLADIGRIAFEPETLQKLEEIVADRKKSVASSPSWD